MRRSPERGKVISSFWVHILRKMCKTCQIIWNVVVLERKVTRLLGAPTFLQDICDRFKELNEQQGVKVGVFTQKVESPEYELDTFIGIVPQESTDCGAFTVLYSDYWDNHTYKMVPWEKRVNAGIFMDSGYEDWKACLWIIGLGEYFHSHVRNSSDWIVKILAPDGDIFVPVYIWTSIFMKLSGSWTLQST